MIIKFFKSNNNPKATMDYLIGEEKDREHAKILQGDADLSLKIADSLDFSNRYTVGCLSFEESDLPKDKKEALNAIKQLEKDLIEQLNNANKNIAENIQTKQSTLIRALTIKMFSLPIILSTLILITLLLANLWLTMDAQSQYQEAQDWKASAEIYKTQAHKMKLSNCQLTTGETKPCIAVDPKHINQNWGKNLKIIEEK